MKKAICAFSCLLFLSVTIAAQAQFLFQTNTDNTLTVTGYTASFAFNLAIPATNNGLPVTSIGANAFQNIHVSDGVTIPDTVTNIGDNAFLGCGMESVKIGNGVLSIGAYAFSNCDLFSVTIPNNVITIGDGAFSGNNLLFTLTLGNGILSIGKNAFNDSSLGGFTIPTNVTTIGDGAFAFTVVNNITIPASVTNLGGNPFYQGQITAFSVDSNNPAYISVGGIIFNKTRTALIAYPPQNPAGAYIIPDSVTLIGDNAFKGTPALTNITIPTSVVSIGLNAFGTCSGLTNATIPASVTNLGVSVFAGCMALTNISVDPNNAAFASVDGILFNKSQTTLLEYPGRRAANSYAIPLGVTNIADEAFYFVSRLTNITIPNTVVSIGNSAFANLPTQAFVIPASVTNLASYAFSYDFSSRVYFQGNPPAADATVFYHASLPSSTTVYYLPGSVGWGNTFAGVSAVLWNPVIQTGDGSFGFQSNQFGFNITGTTNIPVLIQSSASLASPAWTPLTNGSLTNGTFYFSDPQWTNYPGRFYRVTAP